MPKPLIFHDNSHRAVQALAVASRLESANLQCQVIISCGRDTIDRAIAAKDSGDVLVSILDPGRSYKEFDLIFVPSHDPHPNLPNIRTTIGLINRVNEQILAAEIRKFELPKPIVAVLIGGKHVGGNFGVGDAAHLATILNKSGYSTLITTSRRTEDAALETLKDALTIPHIIFDYNHDGLAANPYLAMLAAADKIIVTTDSVRMCSEACSSGKPVFIFTPQHTHFSYLALRDSLFKAGAALPVEELMSDKKTVTLNEAKKVADEIIEYIAAL